MKKILIFGGTTEGREIAQALAENNCANVTVCVATQYGADMFEGKSDNLKVLCGRRSEPQICELMNQGFDCAIDATHPYAVEITYNIGAAAQKSGIKVMRLVRGESSLDGIFHVETAADAAHFLQKTDGNILLATGSKELEIFTKIENYADRIYPRILPIATAIEKCEQLGYKRANIIAMQGPFTKDLNSALIRQFDIKTLVTKDGGKPGGFFEKIDAAKDENIQIIVIGRPKLEEGFSAEEIIQMLKRD